MVGIARGCDAAALQDPEVTKASLICHPPFVDGTYKSRREATARSDCAWEREYREGCLALIEAIMWRPN